MRIIISREAIGGEEINWLEIVRVGIIEFLAF
jgi:hypothetical protein